MAESHKQPLALFDFDGTLCRLATDYVALRARLEALARARGIAADGGLLALVLALEDDPEAAALVLSAELDGLRDGAEVETGIAEYRARSENGTTVAIVSHNSRGTIQEFFRARALVRPDEILDRGRLGAPKDESDAVIRYVEALAPSSVSVVGDSESDRRLAERLGAEFVEVRP